MKETLKDCFFNQWLKRSRLVTNFVVGLFYDEFRVIVEYTAAPVTGEILTDFGGFWVKQQRS